jgi:hypothetical protein
VDHEAEVVPVDVGQRDGVLALIQRRIGRVTQGSERERALLVGPPGRGNAGDGQRDQQRSDGNQQPPGPAPSGGQGGPHARVTGQPPQAPPAVGQMSTPGSHDPGGFTANPAAREGHRRL